MLCTLCFSASESFCEDKKRQYFRCTVCDMIFADPQAHLPQDEEKAIYDFHQNDSHDTRYREFLSQLSIPLLEKLSTGMTGLDFGSGPGPTLSLMLEEHGMKMSIYDIFYAPDSGQLSRQYDFVTCSEVVEHFNQPGKTWPQLISLVKPQGYIGVMTWMFTKKTAEQFNQWSYKGDPTHVSFYTPETMQWIAQHFQLKLEIISEQAILFRRD
ncbi:MAG: 2-polyprenyl-3-methyl-5-hydroxy-6-metoxy-1,4-benzoquinol methylase [Idiomarina sp.]|nr:2-polyprenyl-3-methyl-5-hydroxy-6-metoxy-1,4-benzoquinol methylase [Idiomarina sp.]MBH93674.1 2-polyprenyl-3-methyl-5-hydroxy-6-metoxy-1,4-benzoquinol methylase [Idiomarina sp.]